MGSDRETETQTHARRVAFDRRVEKLFHAREIDDRVEALFDLALPHAEDRAVEIDVLAPGQLVVKTSPYLQQRCDASSYLHFSGGRIRDLRQDLEECALARAVPADDADDLPFTRFE